MIIDDTTNLDEVYKELNKKKKKKRSTLIDQIREMEDDISSFYNKEEHKENNLPSSFILNKENKKQEKKKNDFGFGVNDNEEYDPDTWFKDLVKTQNSKVKGKSRKDIFDEEGYILVSDSKKKKKKKKNKNGIELVDYKKEFEPEMNLYRNLLNDQSKFTSSLQKEYDNIKGVKSSSRGMTKQMTDLVENITDARTLSMQLVEKNVQAKKLIAELTLKQQKELGDASENGDDMVDFGSNYLKRMLDNRKVIMDGTNTEVVDFDDDEIYNELNSSMDDIYDEVDKYLKYENVDAKVYVCLFRDEDGKYDIENYEFEAYDKDGNYIDDYPLPMKTKISVNYSTGIATDTYGVKYQIKLEEDFEDEED